MANCTRQAIRRGTNISTKKSKSTLKKKVGIMDWYDVDDVLYDGTKEEISKLKCPDCGGNIKYSYTKSCECFTISCKSCGHLSISHGSPTPNCYLFFGEEHEIA